MYMYHNSTLETVFLETIIPMTQAVDKMSYIYIFSMVPWEKKKIKLQESCVNII